MLAKDDEDSPDEESFNRAFAASTYMGSVLTIPALYSAIIIGYFFNFTLRQGILTLAISEFVVAIVVIIMMIIDSKKEEA